MIPAPVVAARNIKNVAEHKGLSCLVVYKINHIKGVP